MTKRRLIALVWLFLALALLSVAGWGAVAIASAMAGWLTGVQSDVATAIVAAAATVLVSILTVIVSRYFERRDAIERENRLKKIPTYESLIAFVFAILHQGKPGQKKVSEPEMVSTYSDLTQKMIVWSSDDVLRRFGEFRVASLRLEQAGGSARLLAALEDLMLAIRKDLGHRNLNLTRGDVLRLFINDLAQPSQIASSPKVQ